MKKKAKFKVGDKVRIVNYGLKVIKAKKIGGQLRYKVVDEKPEWVGREVIIKDITPNWNGYEYRAEGIRVFFKEDQLEHVKDN